MAPQDDKLDKEVARLLRDMWFSEPSRPYRKMAVAIRALYQKAGYVWLAEDQRLPSSGEVILLDREPFESGYHLGQLRMIEEGWRKVLLPKSGQVEV